MLTLQILIVLYAAVSVITFVAYALDKSSSVLGKGRVPERTLLLLGLCGGWPGGLVAQRLLRHKNRKVAFQTAFWITVALNVAALLVFLLKWIGLL